MNENNVIEYLNNLHKNGKQSEENAVLYALELLGIYDIGYEMNSCQYKNISTGQNETA